jgi:hypothetical protein
MASIAEFLDKTNFPARTPWRRGAVDIASASGTEDLGSNPARI